MREGLKRARVIGPHVLGPSHPPRGAHARVAAAWGPGDPQATAAWRELPGLAQPGSIVKVCASASDTAEMYYMPFIFASTL